MNKKIYEEVCQELTNAELREKLINEEVERRVEATNKKNNYYKNISKIKSDILLSNNKINDEYKTIENTIGTETIGNLVSANKIAYYQINIQRLNEQLKVLETEYEKSKINYCPLGLEHNHDCDNGCIL